MSDEELNMWIAEKLEPQPSHRTAPRQVAPGSPSICDGWKCPGWTEAGGYIWQPRAFCSDPACTMMLIQRGVSVQVENEPLFEDSTRYCAYWMGLKIGSSVNGNDLGRVVAESFALASGLDAGKAEKTK